MRIAVFAAMGAFVLTCGALGASQTWIALKGSDITQALTDRSLIYERATQRFYASGRTRYTSGEDSWGYWRIEGDMYCSQWPPADGWACYTVQSGPNRALKFVGEGGAETIGIYAE